MDLLLKSQTLARKRMHKSNTAEKGKSYASCIWKCQISYPFKQSELLTYFLAGFLKGSKFYDPACKEWLEIYAEN